MTDDEALENIRRGGKYREAGVAHLYRGYAPRFFAYFVRHRVPRERAEDLVQDVFVSIVRHADGFRGETRIDAWMWAIARNALTDHFRRARPEEPLDEEELLPLLDAQADPPREAGSGLEDCVRRAFAAFAARYPERAEILARVAFDGWSIAEVAAMLRRTPGASREYLSQCRKKLREFLEPCREYLRD
ncbi:MAG: RNA polymerase sigma factor [Burkholderiales bacterium]|nr:RNA polymerase sigma factor [Burkholderiales bacterium]